MTEIKITSDEVGEDFISALSEVIKIRKDRRLQYGDTYLSDDLQFLKYQLENKLKRLNMQMKDGTIISQDKNIECAKDSCIDICNYSLFLLAKILKGDKK